MNVTVRLLIMLLIAVLAGCGLHLAPLPERLTDQGLFVMRIMDDNVLLPPSFENRMQPVINNVRYDKVNRGKGYMLVTLPPGEYTLNSVVDMYYTDNALKESLGNVGSPGKVYRVNKKFTIRAGYATSLGVMYVTTPYEELKNMSAQTSSYRTWKIIVYFADDGGDTDAFLRTSHASLYASLRNKPVKPSEGKFLDGRELTNVRGLIALDRLRYPDFYRIAPGAGYVTYRTGIAARIIRDAQGRITNLVPVDINGFPDTSQCSVTGRRAACLISETEYLLIENDRAAKRSVPRGVVANSVLLPDDTALVVVDKAGKIFTSVDNGAKWTSSFVGALKTPFTNLHSVGITRGQFGYYLYSRGRGESVFLVRGDYKTRAYAKMALPDGVDYLNNVHETDYGLYLDPAEMGLTKSTLDIYSWRNKAWETRELPLSCSDFGFADRSGMIFEASCSGAYFIPYRTRDGGKTWERMQKRTIK